MNARDWQPGNVVVFDTEFIEDGRTIDLLSIGLVKADGSTYYAEPAETDRTRASAWVAENVLPSLTGPVKPRAQIAAEIVTFVGADPEFWAYYADYDWVALCQLYGTMMDLPDGWPMFCRDIKQAAVTYGLTLSQDDSAHNALGDAQWGMEQMPAVLAAADLLPVPQADEGAIERAAEVLAELAGWPVFAECDDPAEWDTAFRSPARALAAASLLAPPVQPGREQKIIARLWEAAGCAPNPDDFKESVRDHLVDRLAEFLRAGNERDTRIDRENRQLVEQLRALTQQPGRSEAEVAEVELGVMFPSNAKRRGVANEEAVLACQTRDLAESVMAFADDAVLMERDCGPWRAARVADATDTEGGE